MITEGDSLGDSSRLLLLIISPKSISNPLETGSSKSKESGGNKGGPMPKKPPIDDEPFGRLSNRGGDETEWLPVKEGVCVVVGSVTRLC